ncbi:MAG: AraC family transcriptional regulator [Clostridiales bacterium]|nr:AraC family transcriptional regulator [Clostridiales bacterium]
MNQTDKYENLVFKHLYLINISDKATPDFFSVHWHNYLEIMIPQHDHVICEVSSVEYRLAVNDILFIWPGELHAILENPYPDTVILQFDPSLIFRQTEFNNYIHLFRSLRCLDDSASDTAVYHKLIRQMVQIYNSQSTFKEARLIICLLDFFITLGDRLLTERNQKISLPLLPNIEKFTSVCSYIRDNCDKPVTLEDAAAYAGFSKYYFARAFKETTSFHFHEYLVNQRMMKAESLLSDSTLSMTDIAFLSGFGSIATFNRIFKQKKGCSPSKFRRLLKSGY